MALLTTVAINETICFLDAAALEDAIKNARLKGDPRFYEQIVALSAHEDFRPGDFGYALVLQAQNYRSDWLPVTKADLVESLIRLIRQLIPDQLTADEELEVFQSLEGYIHLP